VEFYFRIINTDIPGKVRNVLLEKDGATRYTDRVRNEDVLHTVKKERNILQTIKERRLTGLVTSCVGTAF
jgi:hypothetical protein